jgi:uncharacterized protein with HEPN domain
MRDLALVREILRQILWAAQTVLKRSGSIKSSDDFLASDEGLEKRDAICMQLIAIGEGVKNLDRVTGGILLPRYPSVEWKRIMGMRDVLSHHYFDIDAEIVFSVCVNHVPGLVYTLQRILDDLSLSADPEPDL